MSRRRYCDRCKDEIKPDEKYSEIGYYDFCRKKCFHLVLKGMGVEDTPESYKELTE